MNSKENKARAANGRSEARAVESLEAVHAKTRRAYNLAAQR